MSRSRKFRSLAISTVSALIASSLALLPSPAAASQSAWQATEVLTSDAFSSRDAVASSGGGTFVAWTSGTDVKLRYRAINSAFGNTVTVDTGTAPTGVKLQALANNQVAVAWIDGNNSTVEVNFAKVSGATVSDAAILETFSGDLSSQYLNGAIDMSVNASGDMALSLFVTNGSYQRKAYAATFDGSTWSAMAQVSTSEIYVNNTWVNVRADGSTVVVFNAYNSGSGNAELKSVIHDGTSWGSPNLFSLAGGTGNETKPTVGADGTIHVVWSAYTSPRKIGYATMATGATTFTSELLTTSASAELAEMAVAQDGEVSMAYVSGGNSARVITKPAGGSWSADIAAASSNTATAAESYSRINIEYTSTNRLVVAWTGPYDGNRDIYANVREANGTWGSAQMLTADQAQFDMNPVVVAGSDGTAMVHWMNATGPVYHSTLQNGSSTFTSQANPGTANSARQNEARIGVFIDNDGEGTFVFENNSSGISFATSDVVGATLQVQDAWQSPLQILATAPSQSSSAVAGNGDLYYAWIDDGVKFTYRPAGSSFAVTDEIGSSNAKGVRLVTDSAGAVHLFYLDGSSTTTGIAVATFNGAQLDNYINIGGFLDPITSHSYPSEPIQVTVGPGGKLLVSAIFNTTTYTRYAVAATFDGSTWSALAKISGADPYVNETRGFIRSDGSYGVMYIGYNTGLGVQEGKLSFYSSGAWSAAASFSGSMHIAGTTELVTQANDDIIFGFTGIVSNVRSTYTATLAAGTSTVSYNNVGRSDHLLAPEMTELSTGEIMMAFIGRDPANQASATLYLNTITRDSSGTWGTASQIDAGAVTAGENYSRFAIERTGDDTVVVGWTGPWSGSGFALNAAIKPAGGSFTSPISLGVGNNPTIATNRGSAVATMYWLAGSTTLKSATVNEGETSFTTVADHGATTAIIGAHQLPSGQAHIIASQSGAANFLSTTASNLVAPTMYTVSVDLTGTGEGAVANDANSTVCVTDCSFQVQDGTTITFTETAGAVDAFDGWTGACSGTSCTITVSADTTVTAQFSEVHQLAVNTIRPTVSGDAVEEETLTATWGNWTWTGRTSSPVHTLIWQRSTDGNTWTDITGTTDETTYTLTSADAGKLIRVKETAVNAAGTAQATSLPTEEVVGLEVDQCQTAVTSPAGVMGVSVNLSALYTTSRSVTLSMVWDDCRSHALISNDGGFSNATRVALPTNGQISWTLPNTGSDRLPKTVYVKFESPDGSYSNTITDDIILDMTAPVVSSIAKQSKVKSNYTTKIKATDTSSGVYTVYFYDKNKKALKAITYRNATTTITIGTKKAVYIRLKDRAGNYTKYLAIK